jgi:DNA-binding NtrC family response regulator
MQTEFGRGVQTVLVVDDCEAVLAIVREFLKTDGFAVLTANNGLEAIRIAEGYEKDIDILLTEARMPESNGLVLTERLKLLRPAMAVIVMSAALDGATYHKCIAKVQARFLWKPFTSEELLLKVKEIIGCRRKQPQG